MFRKINDQTFIQVVLALAGCALAEPGYFGGYGGYGGYAGYGGYGGYRGHYLGKRSADAEAEPGHLGAYGG